MTVDTLEMAGKVAGGLTAIVAAIWGFIKFIGSPVKSFCADFSYAVTKSVDSAKEMEAAFGENAGQTIKGWLQDLSRQGTIAEIQRNIMAKHLDLGIYICSPDGKCIFANDVLCELFGRDFHDMMDFGWLASIASDERLRVHQIWMDSIKNQLPYNCNYSVINNRTKKVHHCSTTAVPVMAGSVVTAYIGSLIDLKKEEK